MPKITIDGRTVEVEAGTNLIEAGQKVGVQIPDLDRMDPPHVRRIIDPDTSHSYPSADSLDDGSGWTFGRSGGIELKCNIKAIRVERADKPYVP